MASLNYPPIADRGYADPSALVSTDWVAEHLVDPKVRLVESDEDILLYDSGHIPGAVKIDWIDDLNDPIIRDYLDQERVQALLRAKGINNDTIVVLYGDKNNWWACYAFWVLRLFGVENLRIMDGGRALWEKEGRPARHREAELCRGEHHGRRAERPEDPRLPRRSAGPREGRAGPLVDVRSPEEFRGERLHMVEYPNEGATRGGHIPGARSVPWAKAVNPETHTFRPASRAAGSCTSRTTP